MPNCKWCGLPLELCEHERQRRLDAESASQPDSVACIAGFGRLAEICERRHRQYYVARTHDPEDEAVRRALLIVFSDLAEDFRAESEKRPNAKLCDPQGGEEPGC